MGKTIRSEKKLTSPPPAAQQNGNRIAAYLLNNAKRLSEDFRADLTVGLRQIDIAHSSGNKGMVGVFGSSRVKPGDDVYDLAEFTLYKLGKNGYTTVTGGGPGVMQAANYGTLRAGLTTIGVQPDYLATIEPAGEVNGKLQHIVKTMHARKILMSSKCTALIFFPGGIGTFDELFEYLTLMQLGLMNKVPVICMFKEEFWNGLYKWLQEYPLKHGMITKGNLSMIKFAKDWKAARTHIERNGHKRWKLNGVDPNLLADQYEQDLVDIAGACKEITHPYITILGSSKVDESHVYYQDAKKVGYEAARRGMPIYTGGGTGIMTAADEGSAEAGGMRLGFLPNDIAKREKPTRSKHIHVPLNLMWTRKMVLFSADLTVGFPGGFGTLDEIFEAGLSVALDKMSGAMANGASRAPILLYENKNAPFYEPLFSWMEHYPIKQGYMHPEYLDSFVLVTSPDELFYKLSSNI